MNHAIVDDVLANSAVGIFILDADFRVVWTNDALRLYFGLKAEDVHGKDKRDLIHVERFDCYVELGPERKGRWLRHWSQPIRSGIYAGGWVEHYVDLASHPKSEVALAGELVHSICNPLTTGCPPQNIYPRSCAQWARQTAARL